MPKRVKSETHMAQKLRYNKRSRKLAFNCGSRWTQAHTDLVLDDSIYNIVPDRVLAIHLGRSIQAIQARRNYMLSKEGGIYV